ncbi:MAG: hypothetical protein AAFX93_00055 [Verrucomicrobiota bacterium]
MATNPLGFKTVNRTANIRDRADARLGQLATEGDVSKSTYLKVLLEEAIQSGRVITRDYAVKALANSGEVVRVIVCVGLFTATIFFGQQVVRRVPRRSLREHSSVVCQFQHGRTV